MCLPRLTDGIILLDGYEQADAAVMVASEDQEHARRFGWWPAQSTQRDGERAIERWQQQWRSGAATRAFAAREVATGALIGGCEIRLGKDGTAAMSYWVFASHRGRGHATRAARLACHYAFAELGVRSLELHIAIDNLASRTVAGRAGFRHTTEAPRHGRLNEDEILYVRTRDSHPPPGHEDDATPADRASDPFSDAAGYSSAP